MGHIQHRNIARSLCFLLIGGATLLVFNDSQSPGFCPAYPVLGVPACYVVLIYFSVVATTLYAAPTRKMQILFFAVGLLAIATGIYFSTLEIITPGPQCPRLFGIPLPLCFTVPPTMGLILFLGWRDRISGVAS